MAQAVKLTLTLDAPLAARLSTAAAEQGWSTESLAAECVAQHLEVAIRHRVLIERVERIDATLLDMMKVVGELGAPSSGIDLSKVCRFRAKDGNGTEDPSA